MDMARLLVIDPQNDFCDIDGAALPVTGADADMKRLALFVRLAETRLRDIVVTLDSHPVVAIERPTFWQTADGGLVAPFTAVTHADVAAGRVVPRDAARLGEVLDYLRALEAGGRYTLMVWPVHCVLGTWGHCIHSGVALALASWEVASQREVHKVLKGRNPMTEQYSAIRAEVPRADDARTGYNAALAERICEGRGYVFVAGEASSHCVAATLGHVFERMPRSERGRFVVLEDCMSPVRGFESAQTEFFSHCRAQGARVMSSMSALTLPG